MFPANVSPTCSPCGHVMQPVGERTAAERQIGGGPVTAYWHGLEYECVECRTRVTLAASRPLVPGSVGYGEAQIFGETFATCPAKRHVSAEHLPANVRRDSTRIGGTMPLSQRQQAARIVQDFWETDGSNALDALDRIAAALGINVPECLEARAETLMATARLGNTTVYPNGACLADRGPDGVIVGEVEAYDEV